MEKLLFMVRRDDNNSVVRVARSYLTNVTIFIKYHDHNIYYFFLNWKKLVA